MFNYYPQVALVGRMNVGKSTLFNKLSEKNKALVSRIPGTTRDLNFAKINWQGKTFELIDTGGLDIEQKTEIENNILRQAQKAIEKSDLILFLVDGQGELLPDDRKLAKFLKKLNKKTLLVINKIDNPSWRKKITPDFFKLGLGEPFVVSALTGSGTGDLLEEIAKRIKKPSSKFIAQSSKPDLKLSIIGKTNVGKSSILNAILGEERVIVTPLPQTTREPQDTLIKYKDKNILLIDTAGLRKKSKISDELEKASIQKTLGEINNSDVSLLITDVSEPLSVQDSRIARLALENNNGLIIVVNKWDKIEDKTAKTMDKFIEYYQRYFPFLWWAPIIFTSAPEKQRVKKLLDLALEIQSERLKKIDDEILENLMKKIVKKQKPNKSFLCRLKQIDIDPPQFLLSVDYRKALSTAYLKFIERKLREKLGFNGTPIIIKLSQPKGKNI